MKRIFLIILMMAMLISCAPVLREELMNAASTDFSLSDMRRNPDLYKGKLFILGGLIVNTKLTERGSEIEAVYVLVDSRGYLKGIEPSDGRFLAILPREKGFLDPLIYRQGREITLAGEFVGIETGRIDEMEYTYPVFEIKDLYLWEERRFYLVSPPPYPSWYYLYWYYPYPYWWDEPWWRYHPPHPRWYEPPVRKPSPPEKR